MGTLSKTWRKFCFHMTKQCIHCSTVQRQGTPLVKANNFKEITGKVPNIKSSGVSRVFRIKGKVSDT